VRAAEHAPRGPFQLLELRNGFVEIIERGDGVIGERPRVSPPHPEREIIILAKNTACHTNRVAQQCLGFLEALQLKKTLRAVIGRSESLFMFFAIELQVSRVYVSSHAQGLFKPS